MRHPADYAKITKFCIHHPILSANTGLCMTPVFLDKVTQIQIRGKKCLKERLNKKKN
jgi:hypothetical protein